MTTKDKVKVAEDSTNTTPTDSQKIVGNYKKGKVTIKGLKITIENPKGSTRRGVDEDGNQWESEMKYTYGYFNGTVGKDGDQIDVYIGPEVEEDFDVYIIDQVDEETRAFDEHKVMFGFSNENEAKEAYMSCYEEGWKGFENITTISLSKFKKWIKNEDAIKYPAKKLNMSSRIDFKNETKGEPVIKVIRLLGEVLDGITLENLKEQAGDINDFDKLIVEIASPGGSVSEGLEIMVWLDGLSEQGKQIITVVVANAYSIASLIMLVADVKLISTHGKVMVHNPMVPELKYANANELEKYVESLRELEAYMYDLYKLFTGLEEEQIKALMDNETYLSPQEAVDFGFADMVVDIKPKPYESVVNLKKEINMLKTLNVLTKVIAMVNKSEFINQLYSDEAGSEIEIFQNDPSTYQVGDRTSVESSGEDGIKLSDGSKLTIEDYTITEIDRSADVEEEVEEGDETAGKPKAEGDVEEAAEEVIEEDEAQANFNEGPAPKTDEESVVDEPAGDKPVEDIPANEASPTKVIEKTEKTVSTKETVAAQITQVTKWESEVVQDNFEVGTQVEYVPYNEGDEPYSVGAGEWLLDDGRQAITDAGGVIVHIKDAPNAEEAAPAEAKADDEEVAKLKEEMSEIKGGMEEMKALLTGTMENIDKKFEGINKFQDVAAEAIDKIASTTSSSFKPNAKSVAAEANLQGSIFKNAVAKAQAASK